MQASLFVRLFVMIVLVFHNSWLSLHTSRSIYRIHYFLRNVTGNETIGNDLDRRVSAWTDWERENAEATIEANVELYEES